ncbi:hypothetical protein TNCV_3387961 [Trichonephila clavipes]|nr:hypothetical protein TNCV_3387961 [Trichonephila clavipes]
MRSRCLSSYADVTFRRPLSGFQVVQCSSVHCFQTRITVELFHRTRCAIENPPSQRPIILPRSNSERHPAGWQSAILPGRCARITVAIATKCRSIAYS